MTNFMYTHYTKQTPDKESAIAVLKEPLKLVVSTLELRFKEVVEEFKNNIVLQSLISEHSWSGFLHDCFLKSIEDLCLTNTNWTFVNEKKLQVLKVGNYAIRFNKLDRNYIPVTNNKTKPTLDFQNYDSFQISLFPDYYRIILGWRLTESGTAFKDIYLVCIENGFRKWVIDLTRGTSEEQLYIDLQPLNPSSSPDLVKLKPGYGDRKKANNEGTV